MPHGNSDRRYSDDEVNRRFSELASEFGEPTERPAPAPSPRGPLTGPRDYEVLEEDDSFEPPEPGPVLEGVGARTKLAWLGVIAGLLGVTGTVVARWPVWVGMFFTLCLAGGVIALILQLPIAREDRDDDGAVV